MKKQLMTLVFSSMLLLLAIIPQQAYGQFCCCPACPDCISQGIRPNCGAACFFDSSCFDPSGAETSTDATCLGTSCNALPVELADFNIKDVGTAFLLEWSTASELNNEGFEILRANGVSLTFEPLGFISGHGTTAAAQAYSFVDDSPMPGTNYYRLKQIDLDGQVAMSDIIVGERGKKEALTLWPTLARETVLINAQDNSQKTEYVAVVYDMMGRKVYEESFFSATSIDVSNLENGNYVVNITYDTNVQSLRFVKVK
ncbi:MAG: T9SS type A sorting domain-containing protein [Bacteroidota bacterium]